jgi:hypothetical protein
MKLLYPVSAAAAALVFVGGVLGGVSAAPKGQPAPKGKPDSPASSRPADVVVEAKLAAKSPTPTPDMDFDVFVYREGLVIYQYQVLKVVQGALDATKILVAHWGLKRDLVQPVTKTDVGATVTLSLIPFEKGDRLDKIYRCDTLKDTTSPRFFDVGQKLDLPAEEQGRWNYAIEVGRAMRQFHFLKNQLKLVVLGDCQGWFSVRTRLYFPEENLKTPVALCMTSERSCLSLYETLATDYLVKLPKLEWVVFAWQTRWLNGQCKWAGYGTKNDAFKSSSGYKYDMANADRVFKPIDHDPITVDHILANPVVADAWRRAAWGEMSFRDKEKTIDDLLTYDLSTRPKPVDYSAGRTEEQRKSNPQYSAERNAQWERIVKVLMDRKIRVLVYTLPVNASFANSNKKDKNGTTAETYGDEQYLMKKLEEKYKGFFFFFDINNGGNNGLTEQETGKPDHNSVNGAIKVTAMANQFIREAMKKYNFSSRPVGKTKK